MPTTRSARHLRAALLVPALALVAGCQGSTADPSPVTAATSAAPGEDAAATSSSADDAQVTTALALAQESATPTEEPDPTSVSDDDVVAMAQRLTEALEQDDEEEWAALFDADEATEEEVRRWFRSVRAVPMEHRSMVAEVVLARDTSEGTAVRMGFVHQISDADLLAGVESYRVTIAREPGEDPVVVGWRGQNDTDGYPQLWDLADIQVHEVEGAVVLAPADRDVGQLLEGVSLAAQNALPDLAEADDGERLVVALVETGQIEQIAAAPTGAGPAGVVQALPGVPGGNPSVLGISQWGWVERVNVDLDHLEEELAWGTPDGGWVTVRHEAAHALVEAGAQVTLAPSWVVEGFATWYGLRRDYVVDPWFQDVVATGGLPEELPDDGVFDSDQIDRAYGLSGSLFFFVEERFGYEAAQDLGTDLTQMEWRRGAHVDQAVEEAVGMSLEELEAEWVAWMASSYGR